MTAVILNRPRIRTRPVIAPPPGRVYIPPEPALVEGALLSKSLHSYVKAAWGVVNAERMFVDGWHIAAICEHLEAVSRGEIRKLLINVPFRCTKSLTVGVFWPSWEWTFAPYVQWLCLSYAADLSTRDSLRCRTVIESRWYQERWGDVYQLTGDQNVKNRYENTRRGVRISTSLGGLATGEGGDRVVIDDPHNMKEIHSETARSEVIRVWKESISSRLNDPATGAFVGVMQRGHERDFSGYLLAEEGDWVHLCLPMEWERTRPVYVRASAEGEVVVIHQPTETLRTPLGFTDPRRKPGDLLCPARFSAQSVTNMKLTLGKYGWSGQAQQRPTPAEGGLFPRDRWMRYRRHALPPNWDEVIQSWDMAFKKTDDSSRVAGHVWARKGAQRYLLARVSRRMDLPETLQAVVALSAAWPGAVRKLIEDKANGPAVIQLLRTKVVGLIAFNPTQSKEARAQVASVYQEAGNIFLPDSAEAPWVDEFIELAARVPKTDEWDDVDAMSQAMEYFGPGALVDVRAGSAVSESMAAQEMGLSSVEEGSAPWDVAGGLPGGGSPWG